MLVIAVEGKFYKKAIGKTISFQGRNTMIKGVVRDFHFAARIACRLMGNQAMIATTAPATTNINQLISIR